MSPVPLSDAFEIPDMPRISSPSLTLSVPLYNRVPEISNEGIISRGDHYFMVLYRGTGRVDFRFSILDFD